ncbi:hypothetical protein Trydic_g21158 [Trypoxylus dichotomus]
MVSLDLDKGFDKTRHEVLLLKMKDCSFPARILKTVRTYLQTGVSIGSRTVHDLYQRHCKTPGPSPVCADGDLQEFLDKLNRGFFEKPALKIAITQKTCGVTKHRTVTESLGKLTCQGVSIISRTIPILIVFLFLMPLASSRKEDTEDEPKKEVEPSNNSLNLSEGKKKGVDDGCEWEGSRWKGGKTNCALPSPVTITCSRDVRLMSSIACEEGR